MTTQLIVLAKTPVPGRVKTRLCPPYTPRQAARIAAAALTDTLDVVSATPVGRRVLAVEGDLDAPAGWSRVTQRGATLGERIACAFTDSALPGHASLLIGMDTPQVTAVLLSSALQALGAGAAVLGHAEDGGWWALGLRDPSHAVALAGVATSTAQTGARTEAALRARGLSPVLLPVLRDVDTAADAAEVAALCNPAGAFARSVA